MSWRIKIGIAVAGIMAVLSIAAVVGLFALLSRSEVSHFATREIRLPNDGRLIISGDVRDRSEHGTSQRAGYRPPGSAEIEWFGDVSDGVDPGVYFAGPMVVVIDAPSACLFVRNPKNQEKWKSLALVFPNDLGPFPLSHYLKLNGLTIEDAARIDQLGGKRKEKYPTTYIQDFDSKTRDLTCSYHVDNKSSWPLHFQLSEDGRRLGLISIGQVGP